MYIERVFRVPWLFQWSSSFPDCLVAGILSIVSETVSLKRCSQIVICVRDRTCDGQEHRAARLFVRCTRTCDLHGSSMRTTKTGGRHGAFARCAMTGGRLGTFVRCAGRIDRHGDFVAMNRGSRYRNFVPCGWTRGRSRRGLGRRKGRGARVRGERKRGEGVRRGGRERWTGGWVGGGRRKRIGGEVGGDGGGCLWVGDVSIGWVR